MSPPSTREINGPRPARLKIHKDSHHIHKASSSSSSSSATMQQPRHQPVIIYTHSPKVIHTQARDFMALVQKLTGLSHSDEDEASTAPPPKPHVELNKNDVVHGFAASQDDSSSSSDNYMVGDVHVSCSSLSSASMSPVFEPSPVSPLMPEIPFFVPSSSEFFCAMNPSYRYADPSIYPPVANISGSIPPSVMDVMKPFPEY